ncbi:MAG: ribose-phosphate diphosphokinase [Flavobacteriales bacterium]|jgi:ribose-phosphate pyrophosphokinase|nr:ribose-phosphate diphosphokinase [Flavobacteriales bacterium]
MILNLTKTFNPYPTKKEILFESFTFSGGEPHLKIQTDLTDVESVMITQRVNSFNDFGLLLLAIDALKRADVEKIDVFIPYFPAARQDRLMVKGEALSVKVYTEILNNSGVNKVFVYDAHSEVTPALLNNCVNYNNHSFIANVMKELAGETLLISPDGGALKKIYKVASYLGEYEVVEASKSRDVKTGKLSGFQVYREDLEGRDCLVVDDICDGGGTFLGLAKELKKKNAGKLYLAVSHGIFSKGFDALSEYYSKIFVTNSFKEIDGERLIKQIKISKLL